MTPLSGMAGWNALDLDLYLVVQTAAYLDSSASFKTSQLFGVCLVFIVATAISYLTLEVLVSPSELFWKNWATDIFSSWGLLLKPGNY